MDQRVSLITLGCRDVARAQAFYTALGWKRVDTPDGIVVFDLLGQALGLYPATGPCGSQSLNSLQQVSPA